MWFFLAFLSSRGHFYYADQASEPFCSISRLARVSPICDITLLSSRNKTIALYLGINLRLRLGTDSSYLKATIGNPNSTISFFITISHYCKQLEKHNKLYPVKNMFSSVYVNGYTL